MQMPRTRLRGAGPARLVRNIEFLFSVRVSERDFIHEKPLVLSSVWDSTLAARPRGGDSVRLDLRPHRGSGRHFPAFLSGNNHLTDTLRRPIARRAGGNERWDSSSYPQFLSCGDHRKVTVKVWPLFEDGVRGGLGRGLVRCEGGRGCCGGRGLGGVAAGGDRRGRILGAFASRGTSAQGGTGETGSDRRRQAPQRRGPVLEGAEGQLAWRGPGRGRALRAGRAGRVLTGTRGEGGRCPAGRCVTAVQGPGDGRRSHDRATRGRGRRAAVGRPHRRCRTAGSGAGAGGLRVVQGRLRR